MLTSKLADELRALDALPRVAINVEGRVYECGPVFDLACTNDTIIEAGRMGDSLGSGETTSVRELIEQLEAQPGEGDAQIYEGDPTAAYYDVRDVRPWPAANPRAAMIRAGAWRCG